MTRRIGICLFAALALLTAKCACASGPSADGFIGAGQVYGKGWDNVFAVTAGGMMADQTGGIGPLLTIGLGDGRISLASLAIDLHLNSDEFHKCRLYGGVNLGLSYIENDNVAGFGGMAGLRGGGTVLLTRDSPFGDVSLFLEVAPEVHSVSGALVKGLIGLKLGPP